MKKILSIAGIAALIAVIGKGIAVMHRRCDATTQE